MRIWNILLAAFMLSSNLAIGQYLENYEKKALTAFHSRDYQSALLLCGKVLEIDSVNITSLFVAGEAARLSGDFQKAESYLERIPNKAKVGYFAVTDFQLAGVKLDLNKTSDAKFLYQKYINEHNEANNLLAYLAIEALKSMGKDVRTKENPLATHQIPGNINTSKPDFAPLRYGDKMYFTTMVEVDKERRNHNKVEVSRIYEARPGYAATSFEGNPNKPDLSAGDVSLTPDASKVFYTICKGDFTKNEDCEIWFRERGYEGNWGAAKRLPGQVNMRGYSATQPSIGWDKIQKKYILYYASNRPGGRGGMDIWCSVINKDGSFDKPFCLPFNTPQDDVTPFFHQLTQTLFFSSNGWPGKGGFDIFRESKTSDGEWNVPENLGEMLNSAYDETYYSYHARSQNAYLVSNRPNENNKDFGNLDIYEARIFAELQLKVFRSLDNAPVYAPQVYVKDVNSGEIGSFAARNNQNEIQLKLEAGKRYLITVTAGGYASYSFEFSTEDISYFIQLDRQIYLKSPLDP
ncbi:MAG: tetratricopeptide repeat protein [Saprospiraceae bacterium]|nr:tetratricopeptide repeat protein [Saprospiraceae bacterium]MCF8251695.1 tetratricopeptide repeat protein [Saprospiraceae bacterium]MCF8282040.1 tetratricopeptide repeat protein [Bacteroidales bacterium]MCF8311240.1 tetratricopeptide repeat protein [Saprospiraceae bacterium]MCF8442058.1 tetratricopeptide repeat protein [Saprospiraceae bacterium]